jgi:hypothetical protein
MRSAWMTENKAVRPTPGGREPYSTEKKGGYPAGGTTPGEVAPPPASWMKPPAETKPSADSGPSADGKPNADGK